MFDILQQYETGFQKFGLFRRFLAPSRGFNQPGRPRPAAALLCSAVRDGGAIPRKNKDSERAPSFRSVPESLVPSTEGSDQTSLTQQLPGEGATLPARVSAAVLRLLRAASDSASPRFSRAAAAHLRARGQPIPAPQSRGHLVPAGPGRRPAGRPDGELLPSPGRALASWPGSRGPLRPGGLAVRGPTRPRELRAGTRRVAGVQGPPFAISPPGSRGSPFPGCT